MTTTSNSSAAGATAKGPVVYKICRRVDWEEALRSGELFPSPDDVRDGFIHLSDRAQVPGTLDRHFAGQRDLMLLCVDTARLADGALCWEKSRSGQEFPHLYGALPKSAVVAAFPIAESSGRLELPESF